MLSRVEHEKSFITMGPIWIQSRGCHKILKRMDTPPKEIRMFEMNCLFLSGDFKFQKAQNYSFHALEVLPVARNAKFQPMYPLLEGVTVR